MMDDVLANSNFTVPNRPAQDAIALNTGSLSVGHYFVVLICDGQVADSQALQIQ